MYSYRITKYQEYTPEGYLYSPSDEWTEYSDIGGLVTVEDYLKIEHEFLGLILAICYYLKVDSLTISDLEIRTKSTITVVNKENICIDCLPDILTMTLRNKIWCRLISKNLQFHFGYDYYLYCVSHVPLDLFLRACNTSLNIEKFKSPY